MKKKIKNKKGRQVRIIHVTFVMLGMLIGALGYLFAPHFFSPLEECANSISCIKDLSGKFEKGAYSGTFHNELVTLPSRIVAGKDAIGQNVLGDSTQKKVIKVDLTTQHLYAYEGDKLVYDFPVSTGTWQKTPTGTFRVWIKLKYTRMTGGTPGTKGYYNLPNVPHTMYFYNETTPKYKGFGLHGAYWHNNFGRPMSHGCVNLPLDWAEKLFYWAEPVSTGNTTYATEENPGTEVVIYGKAPNY